ncbi:MAG: glycosyltransferase family A protein [Porticoccaceae bacterium]
MRISLITTCKNRLEHLRQTLPGMAAQSDTELIVVDYGCEQGTAQWLRSAWPKVLSIKVDDDPSFCAARARNLGAQQASGQWLFFVDADILLQRDLGSWASDQLQASHYYRAPEAAGVNGWGTFLCTREAFFRSGGYDEAFRGWGGEDVDLYEQLEALGDQCVWLPDGCLSAIRHGDNLRQLGSLQNRGQRINITEMYRTAKRDIVRETGKPMNFANRTALMAHITRTIEAFYANSERNSTTVEVRVASNVGNEASSDLVFTYGLRKNAARQPAQ